MKLSTNFTILRFPFSIYCATRSRTPLSKDIHQSSRCSTVCAPNSARTSWIGRLGCEVLTDSKANFEAALEAARLADVLVVAVGEAYYMSGELSSRASLKLPGVQTQLIEELSRLGKPIVLVVMAGRPLVLTDVLDKVHAVLYVWWLGTEAGHAITDVLVGAYNPSGRLPITFPRSEGQIPIYYNRRLVGRQRVLFYQDIPDAPLSLRLRSELHELHIFTAIAQLQQYLSQ